MTRTTRNKAGVGATDEHGCTRINEERIKVAVLGRMPMRWQIMYQMFTILRLVRLDGSPGGA